MIFNKNKQSTQNARQTRRDRLKAPAYSYYASRSTQSSGSKKQHKGFNWQLIPSFMAAIVIAGSLVYISILDTSPRLKTEPTNADALLQDEMVYTEAAERHLKSSIFNRSKLLINTKDIEDKIRQEFPELKTVGLTIPLTNRRPILTVKAVEPRLLLTATGGSYIIDSAGRAVLKVNDTVLADGLALPKVQDETGLEIQLGKVALTAREAAFISELGHQLAAKNIGIASVNLPALANELHLRITGQPYFVKFNMLEDARQQAGSFVATKEQLEADRVTPSEYIDVRVEEKVFYK